MLEHLVGGLHEPHERLFENPGLKAVGGQMSGEPGREVCPIPLLLRFLGELGGPPAPVLDTLERGGRLHRSLEEQIEEPILRGCDPEGRSTLDETTED